MSSGREASTSRVSRKDSYVIPRKLPPNEFVFEGPPSRTGYSDSSRSPVRSSRWSSRRRVYSRHSSSSSSTSSRRSTRRKRRFPFQMNRLQKREEVIYLKASFTLLVILPATVSIKPTTIHSAEEKRYFLKIYFDNKGIDLLDLPSIFHDSNVDDAVPIYFKNKSPPCISYKYSKSIGARIFNHNRVIDEFSADAYRDGAYSCDCSNSVFKYNPHGHVVTGDLSFFQNSKLQNLIRKGPKYREPREILWKVNKKIVFDAIENYATSWAKREGAKRFVLDDWVSCVKDVVLNRIANYKYHRNNTPSILEDETVKQYLQSVHDKFVLAPADKASNNVIVICKKFYFEVLAKELGINSTGPSIGNNTYQKCDSSELDIVNSHISFLAKYGIVPDDKNQTLPGIYWLPKLHKVPYKFRFIAASSKCTTKHLSVLLTRGLEKVQQYFMNHCKIIYGNSGINGMWILKNSQSLLQSLKDNHIDQYGSISTWDFSTLYTTIPHSDLLIRIKNLIKQTFSKNDDQFLLVNERRAFFSLDKDKDNYLSFCCKEFCDLFEFLINNIYVKLGDEIFRQILGIPMGTNCAPLLANLYLFSYEYDFVVKKLLNSRSKDQKEKFKKLQLARKFNRSYRYIDDLLSINNPDFAKYIQDIYPKELELKETTENVNMCTYLDLTLFRDDNNQLKSKIYDKRDEFSFHIVNYPFLDSNIPNRPAYGVYVSRLVCFARACSDLSDFVVRHNLLVKKLLNQGYTLKYLRKCFSKFMQNHVDLIQHYNIQLSSFLKTNLSLQVPKVCLVRAEDGTWSIPRGTVV